jgi:hypothetical protein
MKFELPVMSYNDVGVMVKRALDAACWDLSGLRDNPGDQCWIDSVEESRAGLEAWVNYQRQTFPNYESSCMLDYEKHWSPCFPFDRVTDRWEFDEAANSWVIVKWSRRRIITRNPKGQK